MRLALPVLLLPVLLGWGCGPRPGAPGGRGPVGDSVMAATPETLPPDRVADGSLGLEGTARYETITVGQAAVLRAETGAQQAAAERALASGMYLGDPYRVLHLAPTPGNDAVAVSPLRPPVGTPIYGDLLVRLQGDGPAPALRFEHAPDDPAEIGPSERRAPSAVGFELLPAADGSGYDRARLLLGDGRAWSEQPEVPIPPRDWRGYAHRLGIAIETDDASLVIDGTAVVEAELYLVGSPGAPLVRASAAEPGAATLLVLEWRTAVERFGGDDDDDDDD